MDFAFSEEQEMLRSQARSFLSEKLPAERVVELAESDDGWDQVLWREMAELGWTGLSIPEARGGSGMGFLEEAVLFEELGYAAAPVPYLSTLALARPLLADDSDDLARIAAGEAVATVAWAEPGAGYLGDLTGISTKAERADAGWTLTGEKVLVVDLGLADLILVAAAANGSVGLWAVAGEGDGVSRKVHSTMDSTRRLGTLELTSARAEVAAEPAAAVQLLEGMRLRALAAAALEAVGVAQRALELAAAHAKERQQFDKPIGTYQAVAHQISDTYMEVELARSLSYWAAWCVAEDDDQAPTAVVAAKSAAAEAAVAACERSIQVHGGIGFTWEHILHRYYKRAQWIESFEGYGSRQRALVADALFDG